MKKLYLLIVLAAVSFSGLKAEYYWGGEITWECLSNGNYRFILKAYRQCYCAGGVAAPDFQVNQHLYSNSPAGTITLTRTGTPKSLAPQCNPDPAFLHYYCPGMSNGQPEMGVVQLQIFTSDATFPNGVHLTGTPPATGWKFWWGSCCHFPVSNIISAPNYGWQLQAVMYPYQNQDAYPCFDNAPDFAEEPVTVFNTGNIFLNLAAVDADMDSLHYDWAVPVSNSGSPVTAYAANYSYNNPFPGPVFDSSNVAAQLNAGSGMITLTSFTRGTFLYKVAVSAYKSGVKVSETAREFHLIIDTFGINTPPVINPVFGGNDGFDTTVYAGDVVQFDLTAHDYGLLPNGSAQSLDLAIAGDEFGAFIPPSNNFPATLSDTTGCLTLPCATLTPAPFPDSLQYSPVSLQTHFHWVVPCAGQYNSTTGNNDTIDYRFFFTVKDDYCPVPAVNSKVVTIHVIDRKPLPSATITQVIFDYDSLDAIVSWNPVSDPFNQFEGYYLYYATASSGPFILVDSVMNINTTTARVHTGAINEGWFRLKVKSQNLCDKYIFSEASPVYTLNLTDIPAGNFPAFSQLKIHPNPSGDIAVTELVATGYYKAEWQLATLDGTIIKRQKTDIKPGHNAIKIDLKEIPDGIYFYSVRIRGVQKTVRLVVIH